MIEYAVILQIAVLASSLGGLEARVAENLSLQDGAAREVVVAEAKARRVSVAGARRAFAKAPYGLPALRAIYATGWIDGARGRTVCLSARLSPAQLRSRTAKQLAGNARLRRSLGALRLNAKAAAAAYTRGVVAGCG